MVGVLLLGALAGSAGAAPVQDAPADVASCGVDEFTTTALDTTRWNTIVRPNAAGYSVSGGQLKLRALTGDMYGDRATAQNLILQDVPNGAWTATTKLDSKAFNREGQQAGLIVYKDDSTFSKFTVINKGTQGRWFEHIFTADKVARLEIGTDTTPPLNDSFPALVSIRVISDGQTIRGEYSGDGITWAPIGRPAKIGSGVKLGLYAADNAQDGPEVPFEFVSLNAQSDEFSGTDLEKCRWSHIEREAPGGYRVANGALEIDTGLDEVDGTAPNLIGQPVPGGTWQAETKIDLTTTLEGQQAGLLLYKEPLNWIKVVLVDKGASSQIEFVRVKDGQYQLDAPFNVAVPDSLTSFYLRMRSSGALATAQYSTNGTTWIDVGKSRDISDLGAGYLGPMALRGEAVTPVTAKFDYVRVAPSPVVPCTANGTPEAGYERLWNGLDLAGTTQAGPGGFDIVNDGTEGCRLVSQGGLGLLWFNTKTYDNFVLRAQFKTADATDNSGIFVRFPNPGTNPQIAIDSGHEIQIREGVAGDGEDQKTGSIYNTKREIARAAKPAGQWNDYEIRYEKDVYTITLNGTVVNTYTNTTGTHARAAGYIGLQNHSTADEVSFRNVRIQPLAVAATNLFTTVGITTNATRANGQIYPPTNPYSLPAEQMPPSGTVGVAPSDASDDVPLRMPDTTGTKPNFAGMVGQVFTLRPADQKPYTKLHFFGTTTDGGPAGGDFTLRYSDNTTATVNVQWPDWCGNATASAHFAIGKLNGRYRANSTGDTAGCGIYHFPVDNPQPAKTLVSVTFPTGATTGTNTRAYLMALTLEATGAIFTMPDLSGQVAFPDDNKAPTTSATFNPAAPNGNDDWYKGAVRVTLNGVDEAGGSGVEQIMYRIDGGAPQGYTGAFDYATEGEHLFEYRSVDGAGNAETYKQQRLKVDAKAPTTTTLLTPGSPLGGDDWYDGAVTVRLNAADGAGSGTDEIRYRIDGAADWSTYEEPIVVHTAGEHVIEFSSLDIAGNEEAVKSLSLKVDETAPTTSVRLNGADPVAEYTSAVRVAFTRDDGDGSGAVETEYRLDGGAWTSYRTNGAFDVTGNSGHKVEYRSIDLAGNVENFKSLIFVIRPPATLQSPVVIPQAAPAPKPKPFASLEDLSSKVSTVSALRAGKVKVNVSCQAVDRGTLSLSVTKAVAKKLGLKSTTLASGSLRCGAQGRGTLTLKPSTKVKRALAKTKGSITATLTLRLTGSAGVARDTQTVTLEGKS
ncbi:OmpL47-type beta-barrel domain-containing protein [Solirubrobacter ginsenosidimutans]|uniref:OmpL47-type beta-barrel domain-containing protein n=1 Tax=Solirubrobacter ginsenosidimutans TaxID=490573 RepID=UPI0022CDCBE3|nr:family 16 glycoside hydrolase [Solirubrobacter ginsenosidimutans]